MIIQIVYIKICNNQDNHRSYIYSAMKFLPLCIVSLHMQRCLYLYSNIFYSPPQ